MSARDRQNSGFRGPFAGAINFGCEQLTTLAYCVGRTCFLRSPVHPLSETSTLREKSGHVWMVVNEVEQYRVSGVAARFPKCAATYRILVHICSYRVFGHDIKAALHPIFER